MIALPISIVLILAQSTFELAPVLDEFALGGIAPIIHKGAWLRVGSVGGVLPRGIRFGAEGHSLPL